MSWNLGGRRIYWRSPRGVDPAKHPCAVIVRILDGLKHSSEIKYLSE
jgi:hypothetical protein